MVPLQIGNNIIIILLRFLREHICHVLNDAHDLGLVLPELIDIREMQRTELYARVASCDPCVRCDYRGALNCARTTCVLRIRHMCTCAKVLFTRHCTGHFCSRNEYIEPFRRHLCCKMYSPLHIR